MPGGGAPHAGERVSGRCRLCVERGVRAGQVLVVALVAARVCMYAARACAVAGLYDCRARRCAGLTSRPVRMNLARCLLNAVSANARAWGREVTLQCTGKAPDQLLALVGLCSCLVRGRLPYKRCVRGLHRVIDKELNLWCIRVHSFYSWCRTVLAAQLLCNAVYHARARCRAAVAPSSAVQRLSG